FKIEQNVNQAIIHTHNANNVSIVNNWIIGISPAAPRGVDAGYGSANSDGVVIEGNKFEDLYCGVYINQATDLSIDANDFVADMGDGAIVFDGTWNFSNIDVINNTATDANYLMFYYGSQGSVTYSGNTLNSTLLSNWKVFNVNKGNFYQTIQAAIVAASAADVIQVAAGTFTETISVNKSLIINGPNIGVDPNGAAPRLDEAVLLDGKLQVSGANTIVIDGIKVRQTNDFLDALLLGGSSVVTLQNSIIERFGVNTGVGARGLTTAAGPGLKTIQNNLFTGDLSGGLYSGHKTWNSGMYVNGGSSTLNILNNVFENCRTAINLDDYNTNIALSGNTFQNSGTLLSFGGTTPTDGSYILGVNDFNPIGAFINLSNVAETFRLDITSSTVIGVPFSSISLATLFDIEATMYHRSRSSRKGLVYYVADHVFVRSDINSSIKTAIAYAAAGDIVNVAPGAYTEAVVLNKAVTLKGANAGVAAGNNPGSRSTETVLDGGFYVTAAATIDGFKIINGSSSGSILNCVTAAVSGITVQNSILQDVAGNQNNGIETIGGANNLTLTNNTITNNWRGI
ncbi:MAG: right-handed parallel beta-helix repeat-containing protein, partial [Bacteroidales bacterium]|nr:right-handed parallel beta-helix repeat-containing protein [Bacteroidales bacterium]